MVAMAAIEIVKLAAAKLISHSEMIIWIKPPF
jgi:hypothetical protein